MFANIYTHSAASSIAAGVSCAFIDLDLTAGSRESWPTGTGVAALTGVTTSGSIQAGLMMCAVVQICNRGGHMLSTCGLIRPKAVTHGWTAAGQLLHAQTSIPYLSFSQPLSSLPSFHVSLSLSRPF